MSIVIVIVILLVIFIVVVVVIVTFIVVVIVIVIFIVLVIVIVIFIVIVCIVIYIYTHTYVCTHISSSSSRGLVLLVDRKSQVVDLLEALGDLAEHLGDARLVGAVRERPDGLFSELDVSLRGGIEELVSEARAQTREDVALGLLEITMATAITITITRNENDKIARNLKIPRETTITVI